MKNQFENDPVLGQLSKAARRPKAPKLSEDLLVAASKDSSVKAGKFKLPALFLSLASATAAVALVAVVANPEITNTEPYSMTQPSDNLLSNSDESRVDGSFMSNPDLPGQASKLLEADFGDFFANKDWSTQLDLEARGYFLVRNSQLFEIYHPIDSPSKFWEITRPNYLEEQGFNSTGLCNFALPVGRPSFLVLASDGGLYNFEPANLCQNGKLFEYLDELQEALNELGVKSTPMF
ncbi:MAG: hypothetical protein ACOYKO_05440 [Rhodoluna sp.]